MQKNSASSFSSWLEAFDSVERKANLEKGLTVYKGRYCVPSLLFASKNLMDQFCLSAFREPKDKQVIRESPVKMVLRCVIKLQNTPVCHKNILKNISFVFKRSWWSVKWKPYPTKFVLLGCSVSNSWLLPYSIYDFGIRPCFWFLQYKHCHLFRTLRNQTFKYLNSSNLRWKSRSSPYHPFR